MDILEEIDEALKDKKGKWKYVPMREKSETDALIDQLLKEFTSEEKADTSYDKPANPAYSDYAGYNTKTEADERREYEQYDRYYQRSAPVQQDSGAVNSSPENDNDLTQVFSREDIANYEVEHTANNAGYSEYNGSANDNYNVSGGFDDDYYDENDFEKDFENISLEDLDDEEYAEFEDFIENRSTQKKLNINGNQSSLKKVLRTVGTAVVAAFTIIGIFCSGLFIFEKLGSSTNTKSEKNDELNKELAQVIYPVVATLTDDFENSEDITDKQLISLSVWEIIINGNLNEYKDLETDEILIPHVQIESEAGKLLGSEQEIEPSDVTVSGVEIKYDKDKDGYVVPQEHNIYTLYPVVKDASEQDGVYTVTAECFTDEPSWASDKKKMPVKTVVFTLKKTDDYYNILSSKTIE